LPITVVALVLYVTATVKITDWRSGFRRQMNELDSKANTAAIDSLLNYETVKYFGNEEFEARRYDESMQRWEKAAVRSQTSLSFLNVTQSAIIAIAVTLIMWRATVGVVAGTMTIGDLVLVNAFMIQIYIPLNFLGVLYREVKQALTDMERMFALNTEHAEVADKPGAPALEVTDGEVRFEHVDFGYERNRQILHDVSFTIPAGRTVAVVGPSGAGKSTLSRLLFRFYDVSGGRITVDGQDIRDVRQASLRTAIGIVPQDTVLFNDTIGYNIAYGRPDATHAEVVAAAELAQIHGFISGTPEGYETPVGERGPQAFRRRETARRDRARRAQRSANPDLRRGHLRARFEVREGDTGGAPPNRQEPDHADDRPPAVDDRRCRRDPRPGSRAHRRAWHPWRASCTGRGVCADVAAAADGIAESGSRDAEGGQLSTANGVDTASGSPLVDASEAITPAVS
jgi:hypothetical protein